MISYVNYYIIWYLKKTILQVSCVIISIILPCCSYIYTLQKKEEVVKVSDVDLKSAYRRLESAGFEPGKYNEDDFSQLSEAITRFQKTANITVNGKLDYITWAKLQKLYDPYESQNKTPKDDKTIKDDLKRDTTQIQTPKDDKELELSKEDLKSVYRRLANAGFDPGKYNENDLSQLSEAIKRFQKLSRLKINGKIDQNTWTKIKMLYDPGESITAAMKVKSIPPDDESMGLKPDVSTALSPELTQWPSNFIKLIQKILKAKGYYNGQTINGIMDDNTKNGIKIFQKKYGINPDGLLNNKTLAKLFDVNCKSGCEFSISLSKSDVITISDLVTSDSTYLNSLLLKNLFLYSIQTILNQEGYETRTPDGTMNAHTHKSISQFQKDHNIEDNGELNKTTAVSIFSAACKNNCDFSFSVVINKSKSEFTLNNVVKEKVKPVNLSHKNLKAYPIHINDKVYAIEKYECSPISGDWILFYEGTVAKITEGEIFVKLENRFGYRYRSKEEGINSTDWWCIPMRRHCYAPVEFSDWDGKYAKNQMISFPINQVVNKNITIINGISLFLKQFCNR
jgi:peptidoglycan hydrolase-like protein with peptidoglycan-binding domain